MGIEGCLIQGHIDTPRAESNQQPSNIQTLALTTHTPKAIKQGCVSQVYLSATCIVKSTLRSSLSYRAVSQISLSLRYTLTKEDFYEWSEAQPYDVPLRTS